MQKSKGNSVLAKMYIVLSIIILILGISLAPIEVVMSAETGQLTGKIIDAETGEAILGATVMLEGTTKGNASNIDGLFTIKDITPGVYTLIVSSMGYTPKHIEGFAVLKGSQKIDIAIEQKTLDLNKKITVTADVVRSSDAGTMRYRQKATAVSDAIGAQTISRSGGGNAAQAMMRVTGASVADGKYAVIRGLGDRYTNTRLNGGLLPSADPEKQAFNMDLVPSNLLDNIVITKSYTADQPGNFTGGSINLITKDFPDGRTLSFSAGTSYNALFTGKEAMMSSKSSTDWLGYDSGMRDIPKFIKDNLDRIPMNNVIYRSPNDSKKALFLDSVCKALDPEFNPHSRKAPINQNYSLSYGDNILLFGRSLGVVGNLTYDRSQSVYTNADQNLYAPLTATSLDPVNLLKDNRSVDGVLWGGLASLNYNIAPNHKISARYVYNRDGKAEMRYLRGVLNDYGPGETFESYNNDYTQRTLRSAQLSGVHELWLGLPMKIEWQYSDSKTLQKENLRQFAYNFGVDSSTTPWDTTTMGLTSSLLPTIYWRDIAEKNREFGLDFRVFLSGHTSFKFGASYLNKERNHRQTAIKYQVANTQLLDSLRGDMDAWIRHAGLTDSSTHLYQFDNYAYLWPSTSDEYDGSQKIPAWYLMLETPLFKNLTMVAGVRHERTDMKAKSLIALPQGGQINSSDWLPSVNLIYALSSSINCRAAYSRTLARPNLREMATFRSLEFAASKYFYGNDSIRYTKITNYDLRWEWFMRPNEILAVSAFYKKFIDPIEIAYTVENYDRHPVNSPEAKNFGLEFEFRKQLDQLSHYLSNFNLGGNLTLVRSRIKIPYDEYVLMRNLDPNANDERPMTNQSPYLVNLNVGYNNTNTGTAVTLLYNVFGRRFYYNAVGASPDIYEMPRRQLDLTFSQNVFHGVSLKASAKNMLNSHFEADYYYIGTGQKITFKKYDIGSSFSLGLNYEIF